MKPTEADPFDNLTSAKSPAVSVKCLCQVSSGEDVALGQLQMTPVCQNKFTFISYLVVMTGVTFWGHSLQYATRERQGSSTTIVM